MEDEELLAHPLRVLVVHLLGTWSGAGSSSDDAGRDLHDEAGVAVVALLLFAVREEVDLVGRDALAAELLRRDRAGDLVEVLGEEVFSSRKS